MIHVLQRTKTGKTGCLYKALITLVKRALYNGHIFQKSGSRNCNISLNQLAGTVRAVIVNDQHITVRSLSKNSIKALQKECFSVICDYYCDCAHYCLLGLVSPAFYLYSFLSSFVVIVSYPGIFYNFFCQIFEKYGHYIRLSLLK